LAYGFVRTAAVGTTAIGAALAELQPVWLHRGEHFFLRNTGMYTCAGAPVFGPDGPLYAGMLDLTGIDVARAHRSCSHLADAVGARRSSNRLGAGHSPIALMRCRLNWPGRGLGSTMNKMALTGPRRRGPSSPAANPALPARLLRRRPFRHDRAGAAARQ
jgi:hypothetical protein